VALNPDERKEMMKTCFLVAIVIGCAAVVATAGPISVTQTTDGPTLAAALGGGGGLTIDSVTTSNGAVGQYGTYTGFTPVTSGVVMSSGLAADTTAANHSINNTPSTDTGAPGTAEFDAYGPGHITNFSSSNDVAVMTVHFTLSAASQVGFNFIFGSIEYPDFTDDFTDAFVAFLDGTGTANQIAFDSSNNAIQVGSSFASALTTGDPNSAFYDPHGLVKLTTFTVGQLSAGSHTLMFEVGDVNDHILDSAVFISNLHAGEGQGGTNPSDTVPEPTTLALMGGGLAALAAVRRRKRAN
jgi:hypothetical protein